MAKLKGELMPRRWALRSGDGDTLRWHDCYEPPLRSSHVDTTDLDGSSVKVCRAAKNLPARWYCKQVSPGVWRWHNKHESILTVPKLVYKTTGQHKRRAQTKTDEMRSHIRERDGVRIARRTDEDYYPSSIMGCSDYFDGHIRHRSPKLAKK